MVKDAYQVVRDAVAPVGKIVQMDAKLLAVGDATTHVSTLAITHAMMGAIKVAMAFAPIRAEEVVPVAATVNAMTDAILLVNGGVRKPAIHIAMQPLQRALELR